MGNLINATVYAALQGLSLELFASGLLERTDNPKGFEMPSFHYI
jgi:hypothetical protein